MLITLIAGARPNFMKIAPLIKAIQAAEAAGKDIHYRLVHTGQHYDKNMSATATKVHVGHRYAQFFEEGVGHILVVVLSRVHEAIVDIFASCLSGLYGFDEWRNLHEVRTCACDKCYEHIICV